jgi:2,3-diketo-5-methylthio-1-phosphopentane phosphatase
VFALDTSREAVERHLEALYRTLVGWGFFHLNLDALGVAAHGDSSDPSVGPAERVRRGLAAVRRGAGDEAFLLASGCPLGPAVGLVDGMRVAPDPALPGARTSALARLWMHRRLWLNDPGPLLDGAALPPEAVRAWAALIAETGGIAFASGDLAAATRAERALLRQTVTEVRALDARGLPGLARVAWPLDPEVPRQVVLDEPARLATSPLAVFCDFDGTFSMQDVGSSLAARYAAERRPAQWARYERDEITPWEYNLEILEGLPVGTDVLDAFLASVELDPGARALLAWCGAQHVPFRILSDGFDWNLNRLQGLLGVRFAYTANRLRVEHGRWRIRAGAPDPTCGCGTGTCKGGILRAYRAARPGTHLVHVGNGRVSDTCGALAADTVFAKDTLAESLERRGKPFVRFATLHDVIPHLAEILTRLASGG